MTEIGFGTQCLTVIGFLNVIAQIRCQYPALHPVSFAQTPAEWHSPHQPRNPPWQFSTPRKRSPDSMQIYYNTQTTQNHGPFGNAPNFQPSYQSYQNQGPQNYQSRSSIDLINSETRDNPSDPRLLSDSAFTRISETLGAINTVGHYLVDMVNEEEKDESDPNLKQLPQALYTISKNVLGRNVTDKIAPIVKKALPRVLPDAPITKIATGDTQDSKSCTTPEGEAGICEDLSNCPQLLLNLISLRESLCFKDLFVPGVCCPKNAIVTSTPAVEKPVVATTSKPTYLVPVTTPRPSKPTTTKRPSAVLVLTTKRPRPATTHRPSSVTTARPPSTTFATVPPPVIANFSNIVDISECGQREDEGGRIVGGTESAPGAWPWMVAIYLHGNKRREFWCGGTLVGTRHVLTAAHCTRDSKQRPFPPRQFSVRLGDVDLSREDEPSRPVTLRVVAVKAHEQFSRVGYYNDIAVLVLGENVQKSKYVIPICLPTADLYRHQFDGSVATVVGWGTTRYGGTESSRQLEAKLPVWRNEDCDKAYFQPITEAFLCAGYARGGVDACQGDSGGPLMLQVNGRWTQIGVVSFGNKCGEPGYPGVYTRLTHYAGWLNQNLV
ncbi:proclotting enzyme-like isoform X2 [Cydia pomonella]|uniref:proclotting enzyme-like isoform X2 n=1 Tax=Cydia pomonella TaxID=82600 RepID=UPI002ADD3D1D|nr:proclotting enzyme-like isoform X2 [Cydia pomonella]